MSLFSQWHRDEEGATSVEVAVCVGAFLLILLGVLEFAIDMWIWNGMTMAVQQGGRTAMVYAQTPANQTATICDDAWTGQVQTVVQSYLPGNSAHYTLGHSCTAAASPVPRLMTITASYTVGSMSVPGATGVGVIPGFTLTTQATVPLN
jgi:Flp pilus assembly protein TadG